MQAKGWEPQQIYLVTANKQNVCLKLTLKIVRLTDKSH